MRVGVVNTSHGQATRTYVDPRAPHKNTCRDLPDHSHGVDHAGPDTRAANRRLTGRPATLQSYLMCSAQRRALAASEGFVQMKRWLIALLSSVLALTIAIGASLALYVFPSLDTVSNPDAIVVLGPPRQERIDLAFQLAEQQEVESIVIFVSPWNNAAYRPELIPECEDDRVQCLVPEPFTTRGEALTVQRLAETENWSSVSVITMTAHAARADATFGTCTDLQIGVEVADHQLRFRDWAYQYAYQTAGFLKFFIVGCR